MILADVTQSGFEPSALVFGIWVLCAFVALNGIATLIMLVKYFRNDPERREVTISPDALTRREFDDARIVRDAEIKGILQNLKEHIETNRREHENLFSKIGGVERGARLEVADAKKEDAESRRRLHQEITTLTGAISRLDGKIEGKL